MREELKSLKPLVTMMLEKYPVYRSNDDLLYRDVISFKASELHVDLSGMNVSDWWSRYRKLGFPTFEAIQRNRQLVQKERPDLRADDATQKNRRKAWEEYRDQARS